MATATNQHRTTLPSALPPDILADILAGHLTQPPACALSLLCPEWSLCNRPHAALEAALRTTRVDTYTLPNHPNQHQQQHDNRRGRGTVSTNFDHTAADHLCLPHLRDPRTLDGGLARLPPFYQRELLCQWARKSVVVVSQREKPAVVALGADGMFGPRGNGEAMGARGMVILREEGAVRLVPFEDDFVEVVEKCELPTKEEEKSAMRFGPFEDGFLRGVGKYGPVWEGEMGMGREEVVFAVDGREKEALPLVAACARVERQRYLFQRIRHLVVNCVPAHAEVEAAHLETVPSIWWPGYTHRLVHVAERLDYERRANLRMRWDAMERLETLCLDLRGYSLPRSRFLFEEDVVRLARSLLGKGLELLVIAGLRSWFSYPGPDPLAINEVERGVRRPEDGVWVSEKNVREVNWWKMFQGAVRPGGRLVFVDRENEHQLRLLRPHSQTTRCRIADAVEILPTMATP